MSVRKPRLKTARPVQSFSGTDETLLVFAARSLVMAIAVPFQKNSEPRGTRLLRCDELDQRGLTAHGRLDAAPNGGPDLLRAGDTLTVASQRSRKGCVVPRDVG